MPSTVAEIGAVIERRTKSIGLIHYPDVDGVTKQLIAEKRAAYEKSNTKPDAVAAAVPVASAEADSSANAVGFPAGATPCAKCNALALVLIDGCRTGLNCVYSKWGDLMLPARQ